MKNALILIGSLFLIACKSESGSAAFSEVPQPVACTLGTEPIYGARAIEYFSQSIF